MARQGTRVKWRAATVLLWVSFGLLAVTAVPVSGVRAIRHTLIILCGQSYDTPLAQGFIAGHVEISEEGDLTLFLSNVRPNAVWACEASCLDVAVQRRVWINNCGVSTRNGVLGGKVSGAFTTLYQDAGWMCAIPLLMLTTHGSGMFCMSRW